MQIEYRAEKKPSGVLPHLPNLTTIIGGKKNISKAGHIQPETVPVSAVIITFNEESIITKTLSRLWWCDEVIIIDSGSTDKTVSVCEKAGCSVFTRPFTGFGDQKSYGVSKARNNWILCIDADEVLTDELISEIGSELGPDKIDVAAFSIPRNLVFMNRVFHYGKETNSFVTRLFDKTRGCWDGAVVHERVIVNGTTKNLRSKILHYSYHDYSQFLNKINLYSSLGARKMLENNRKKNRLLNVLSIPFNFFRYYILHRNFMNGYRGFAWSALNTCYHFVKYLKLEELRAKNRFQGINN